VGIGTALITGFVWPLFCTVFGEIIDVINPNADDIDKMVENATYLCYELFIYGTLAFGLFVISRYSFQMIGTSMNVQFRIKFLESLLI